MNHSSNYSEEALFARESLFRQRLSQLRNTGEIKRQTVSTTQAGVKELEQRIYLKNVDTAFGQGDPRQLEKLALLDSLTELYNHDTVIRMLKDEVKRCQRYKKSMSILAVAIDSITQLEKQTPIVSDSILKNIAQILMQIIRDVDIPGRYDRDRIIIICPETSQDGALCLSDRLCRQISAENISQIENSKHTTISIGIAEFAQPAENEEQLLYLAFQALKLVENAGGNNYGLMKAKTLKRTSNNS